MPSRHLPRLLDLFERMLVVTLFLLLCMRLTGHPQSGQRLLAFLFVAGESVPVVLVVIRRPARTLSLDLRDWAITLTATIMPLLVRPGGAAVLPLVWCGAFILSGFALQFWAKLALGRSFGLAPADRGLKVGGPYRLIRHPAYSGYLLMDLGFTLANPNLWNLAIYAIAYAAQFARIFAEERVLYADPAYRLYAARVRWRMLPGVF